MTSATTLTWMLSLIRIHYSFAYHEIVETIEVLRALGNSYCLACSGGGSGLLYVRFMYYFCRALAVVGFR